MVQQIIGLKEASKATFFKEILKTAIFLVKKHPEKVFTMGKSIIMIDSGGCSPINIF